MNDSRKPFACSVKGCDMTFSVEDHLTVHRTKHDLLLNINTNKTCDLADQTPTPTRFLRNCDEVGLFQDLHLNPFDELFKKATESPKTDLQLEVITTSDDTLHTPHILPHIQECAKKYDTTSENSSGISNDFTITLVDNCNRVLPTIVIQDESSDKLIVDNINVKNKLKHILLKNNANIQQNEVQKQVEEPTEQQRQIDNEIKEKIREMNRAAQLRCRTRKRMKMKKFEQEMQLLKNENKKLCLENLDLKAENIKLKEMLLQKAAAQNKVVPQDPSSYIIISSEPTIKYPIVQKPILPNNIISNHLTVPTLNIPINTTLNNNNKKSFLVLQNPKHIKSKKFRRIVPKINSKSDGIKKN